MDYTATILLICKMGQINIISSQGNPSHQQVKVISQQVPIERENNIDFLVYILN